MVVVVVVVVVSGMSEYSSLLFVRISEGGWVAERGPARSPSLSLKNTEACVRNIRNTGLRPGLGDRSPSHRAKKGSKFT
jgi:hypothetical protein